MGSDLQQPAQLREKMNTYAGYVLDGSLERQYHETAGQHIIICLECVCEPTREILAILDHTALKLDELGMALTVKVRQG